MTGPATRRLAGAAGAACLALLAGQASGADPLNAFKLDRALTQTPVAAPATDAGAARPTMRRGGKAASSPRPAAKGAASAEPVAAPGDLGEMVEPPPQRGTPVDLAHAVELALRGNLAALLAQERHAQAAAELRQSYAALLPNLSVTGGQANQTFNARAQGFVLPGEPDVVGPFNSFDARLRLSQSLFDPARRRAWDASRMAVDAAVEREALARQQVAAAAALAYVEALRSERAVNAAQANLRLARSLLDLARDQRTAGVATGVDLARAETSVAQDQLALATARTSAAQARLQLNRLLGLPLGEEIALTDPLRYVAETPQPTDEAIATARSARFELRALQAEVQQRDLERSAVRAQRYPSVELAADAGASGLTPVQSDRFTRSIGVRMTIPVFNGGLIDARVDAASSRLRQAELQLRDATEQVEQDTRLALVTLGTAAEQVTAAEATLHLSERLVRLARDRFAAGVADNLEVLDAQTALASARSSHIAALAAWNAARINLASALGRVDAFRF